MIRRVVSSAGRALIKAHEGLRLQAYPDPASGGDPWTIGYGHTKGVKPGDVITEEQADAFLAEDLAWVEDAVNRLVKAPVSQPQFDALASLVFNIGAGAFERSTLLRHLNAGDYMAAAAQFARWVNAAGKKMPGLVKRRSDEAAKFRDGMNWPPHNVRHYSDTPAPTAPPAPSAPLVQPGPEPADYHTPAGEAPSWTPPQEQTMPILPGLIQAFGPGLIKGLASTLIEGFAPLAKEKLQKEMGRHTDNPAVADQIAENLVGAAMQLTGIEHPVQAVAAAQQRPEVQQQVQESALEHLNRMAPILDRLAALDAQQAKLVEDSREAAERRARETLQAGGEDQDGYLTRSVVRMMIGVMVGLGVLAAVLKAMDVDVDMILGTVMTLAGVVATSFRDRYGHRYGSSNGSAAKDAVIGELTRRR